ncbi:Early growth response protein 1 [Ceratocystis lukuohia]|uniref:Early growth response protein 1 n=1 Tax=Ceratocystis lukuohia TaxID=2019550 RepID=A0ABR4MET8_9PEZI
MPQLSSSSSLSLNLLDASNPLDRTSQKKERSQEPTPNLTQDQSQQQPQDRRSQSQSQSQSPSPLPSKSQSQSQSQPKSQLQNQPHGPGPQSESRVSASISITQHSMIDTVLPKSTVEFPSVSYDSVLAASLRGSSAPASDTANAFSTTVAVSPTPPTSFTPSPGRHSTTRSKTDARAPTSSGPHVCPDCQRQYSRSEHLARHIQSHTLGKRFQCPDCGKAFARTDLLRRHAQSHKNEDGSKRRRTGAGAPRAGRVSHACKQCSTARVKCEEAKPCTRCRLRNLTCEYNANEAALALYNPHLKASTPGGLATTARSSLRQPLAGEREGEIEESTLEPAPRSMPELISGSKSTLKPGAQASSSVSPMRAPDGLENPSGRLLPIPVETLENSIPLANSQQQAQQQSQKQAQQQQQQNLAQPSDSVLFQLRQPEMPFSSMNLPGSDFYCPEASNNANTREIPGTQVASLESRLELGYASAPSYQRAHPIQQSPSEFLTQSAQDFQSQGKEIVV